MEQKKVEIEIGIEIIIEVKNIQDIKINQVIVLLQSIDKKVDQVHLQILILLNIVLNQNQGLIQVKKKKILQKTKIFLKV